MDRNALLKQLYEQLNYESMKKATKMIAVIVATVISLSYVANAHVSIKQYDDKPVV